MPEDDERRRRARRRPRRGAGCRVAYAIGGSASDASTDPSETYCVSQTVSDEDRQRRRHGQRRQHREHAARGRHALAAAEPQPDRIDVADDRREPGRGRRRGVAAEPLGEQHARRALRDVEHRDEHAGRHARTRAARWRRRGCRCRRAADRRAPPPREQQRERHRADEIRDERSTTVSSCGSDHRGSPATQQHQPQHVQRRLRRLELHHARGRRRTETSARAPRVGMTTAIATVPTGFSGVPPPGPAMPVMPTPTSVPARARCPRPSPARPAR